MQEKPRDVVVVRVSEQGDREDENFHSPRAQLARARLWSEEQGNRVVTAFEEIDVSGKLPLARRPGLLRAIEMVEAGEADHIVVAYFDRLVRSLKVQLEVIERVEQAGGEIYAIDHGRLTNGTAATRMSNNMMGAAFQYYAEVTGEKVKAAQERVVARGVLPNSRISPGYVRGEDGVLVVERGKARVVVQAFKRRDRGASLVEIQALLAENGIERSISVADQRHPLPDARRGGIDAQRPENDGWSSVLLQQRDVVRNVVFQNCHGRVVGAHRATQAHRRDMRSSHKHAGIARHDRKRAPELASLQTVLTSRRASGIDYRSSARAITSPETAVPGPTAEPVRMSVLDAVDVVAAAAAEVVTVTVLDERAQPPTKPTPNRPANVAMHRLRPMRAAIVDWPIPRCKEAQHLLVVRVMSDGFV